MELWWLLALLIGFFSATVASYIGIGGGLLLTPLLILFFSFRGIESPYLMQHIFATNMFFMVFASTITATRYKKMYHINYLRIRPLMVGAAIGALGGSYLATVLPGQVLKTIFGVALIVSALKFLTGKGNAGDNLEENLVPLWLGILGGFLAGGLAPLAGIGGGVVLIPIFALTFRIPVKHIPGYSHSTIIVITAISLVIYTWRGMGIEFPDFSIGFVNVLLGILLILGALPGIWVGIHLNKISSATRAKQIIGSFVFLMGLYITFIK